MKSFRKKIYAAAAFKTVFFGPGRPEFDPAKPMPSFESYLKETSEGTLRQLKNPGAIDEGVIGSFMASRFLKQANLPGFLPFMVPGLKHKPCTAVEGACGTGGRAIGVAIRSLLADLAEVVFVAGFEVQNVVKSVYGADILAGAGYYSGERKEGHAFFFPSVFSERVAAYKLKYPESPLREAMAAWYEKAILNARKDPKAQEYYNKQADLKKLGMTKPDASKFLPELNLFDCSKVSDGAASIIIATEEGLKRLGIEMKDAVEICSLGEAEADITQKPDDATALTTTQAAVNQALSQAQLKVDEISLFEVHDCFTISGILSIEALGLSKPGEGPKNVLEGNLPQINVTGGLIGFGHPTGATGVRQLVDLTEQLISQTPKTPYGLMISMGGNDKTVSSIIVKKQ